MMIPFMRCGVLRSQGDEGELLSTLRTRCIECRADAALLRRSNPTFGHSLERSWPLVFDCDDPELARKCGNEVWKVRECQCLDE